MKQGRGSPVDWAEIAERIVFVPDDYAKPTVDSHHAMDMLRCDEDDLNTLIRAGLPQRVADGVPYFDPNDLYNLGMYSHTGETQPELAFKMLFRFMTADPATLTNRREWFFNIKASCVRCLGKASEATWDIATPSTEKFGGTCNGAETATGQSDITFSAIVSNGCSPTPIVSDLARGIAMDFLHSGLRWQMLPPAMQTDFETVHALGVTNCISASLALASSLEAAGYQAVAQRGWFCGVLGGIMDLPHAWVEVVDTDSKTKAIDAATALLALKVPKSERFQELCIGTPFNRVIPSTKSADQPLASHSCGASDESVIVTTDIRNRKPAWQPA